MGNALSNINWTADFRLTINPTPSGRLATNNPSVYPLVFNNNGGPITIGCTNAPVLNTACTSYATSNNNAIAVLLVSPPPTANCNGSNPNGTWAFRGFAKWGTTTYNSNDIPLTANTVYYIRLQRVTAGFVRISVFSDPGFCNHIPNSPQCFAISPNITGLSFIQHETATQGSWRRIFNGSVSNVRVDNGPSCGYKMATAGPDYVSCSNTLGNFTLGSASNPTGPGYTYAWTPTTNVTGPSNGPTLSVTNNNTLNYIMNYTSGGCPFADTVAVAAPVTVNAGPDVVNCLPLTQSMLIGSSSNPAPPLQTYVWTSSNPNVSIMLGPGGTNGGATGIGASTIVVTATNQYGCTASDTLEYFSGGYAGPDMVYCHYNPNGGVMIGGDYPTLPGYTYSWTASPAANAGIDCPTCPRTLVNPLSAINTTFTYTLTVTLPSGQTCSDQVLVSVQNNTGNPIVTLPASYNVNCVNPGATTLTPSVFSGINPIGSYAWHSMTTPSINNLNSATIPAPTFTNCNNGMNPAVFFITVTDTSGCQASARTVITYTGFPPSSSNRTAPGGFTKALPDKGAGQQVVVISPNPNKGQFAIQGLHSKPIARVVISNSDGRRVKVLERVNAMQAQVHLPMADGIYLAEVWLAGMRKPVVQKIVIANR